MSLFFDSTLPRIALLVIFGELSLAMKESTLGRGSGIGGGGSYTCPSHASRWDTFELADILELTDDLLALLTPLIIDALEYR